jgi:uncharacterized protein
MTTASRSALFLGTVMHRRVRPVEHRLSYRVFSLLVDLDELPALDRRLRLFSYNRPGLLSFHDRDHGPGDGTPLKPWVRRQLHAAGIAADGAVRILCFPRVLGYVFNPLCVWFCHRADDTLAAVLYEVNNTFSQRHFYLIPAAASRDGTVRQRCAKAFYVSPFMDMATDYEFRIRPPDLSVAISVRQTDAAGAVFYASHTARREPLTDRALIKAYLGHPLMTFKVIAGIHWEAFKLWRKGMRVRPRPPEPERSVSIVLPKAAQHG